MGKERPKERFVPIERKTLNQDFFMVIVFLIPTKCLEEVAQDVSLKQNDILVIKLGRKLFIIGSSKKPNYND